MADREQRNGRMLFTDFDASDMGRPVAVFDEAPAQAVLDLPPPPPPNVPSLDDIAASLGFEFEDDGDDAPAPSPLPQPAEKQSAENSAAEKTRTPPAASALLSGEDGGDSELALGEVENLKKKTGVYAAPALTEAPTWDALTSAYTQARPVGPQLPGAPDRFTAAFAPLSAAREPEQDDAVDVLSLLDEYLEREQRAGVFSVPPGTSGGPVSGGAEPFPEARPLPYGGVERVDDWFAPPENQPEPLRRVEDWFAPPGDQPEPVARIDDWYEPPEEGAADGNGDAKVDLSWLSDFRNELPAGEYWHKKTTRILKKDSPAGAAEAAAPDAGRAAVSDIVADAAEGADARSADDTADLFSGMDFDSIWERKVAARQQPAAAAASARMPAGDTRRISLFDDIDIDSLWEQKQETKSGSGPDTTVIVPQDALSAAATVILRDGMLGRDVGSGPGPGSGRAGAGGSGSPRGDARPPDPEALDVLEELDAISADSPPRRGASAMDAPSVLPVSEERDAADRDASGVPDASENFSESSDIDALVEEAAGMDFAGGGRLMDGDRLDHDDADGEAREYVARTPPAEARRRGLSTDDLLDGVDLDSLAGESGGVSAPVIDDSAIDAIPKATRSGTAEMRAVAEGDTVEEEPAAVAVNPMDVFADMDNMDFSDDVDDDMRSMLEDEEAEGAEEDGAAVDAQAGAAIAKEMTEVIPATRLGRAWWRAGKVARRHLPMRYVDKLLGMVAWRENWWFYCDLVAAVVASASAAVIISYFFWYRGV